MCICIYVSYVADDEFARTAFLFRTIDIYAVMFLCVTAAAFHFLYKHLSFTKYTLGRWWWCSDYLRGIIRGVKIRSKNVLAIYGERCKALIVPLQRVYRAKYVLKNIDVFSRGLLKKCM